MASIACLSSVWSIWQALCPSGLDMSWFAAGDKPDDGKAVEGQPDVASDAQARIVRAAVRLVAAHRQESRF